MKHIIIGLMLTLTGCATNSGLVDHLQTSVPIPDTVPTKLTDWGIFKFGEKTIEEWGGVSQFDAVLSTGGAIVLATLSTAALATSGRAGVSPDVATGLVGSGNWLLQMLGIIKPTERNDYRIRGETDITVCRGDFFKSLAAKKIGVISTRRFTPQGSIYLDCIGGARVLVKKGINGLRPDAGDFARLAPVPPERIETLPEQAVSEINAEIISPRSAPTGCVASCP